MTLHASLNEEWAHLVVQLGGMYISPVYELHTSYGTWGVPVHYIYVYVQNLSSCAFTRLIYD